MDLWTEAAAHTDAARRVTRRHVAHVLPGLSEAEQITFLKQTDSRSFSTSLTLGYVRREDPSIRAVSAGWLINGKALAQEALAQRALLARAGRIQDLQNRFASC